MPQRPWDLEELRAAKAIFVGSVKPSDLEDDENNTVPWVFFHRDKWDVSDEQYEALLPSMRLASKILQAGMGHLCLFIPSDPVHDKFISKGVTNGEEDAYTIAGTERSANMLKMDAARAELREICKVVRWTVNNEILRRYGWLGITRQISDPTLPWEELDKDDIVKSDNQLKRLGEKRRHLLVGVAGEYVKELRKYPNNHERHLRAAFMAAITMAHEIAHVVWHQDFRSIDYTQRGEEPWVGFDSDAELGNAFIASVFGGSYPKPCNLGTPVNGISVEAPLHWYLAPSIIRSMTFNTLESISMSFMESLFSKSFWADMGDDPTSYSWLRKARNRLDPRRLTGPQPAKAVEPEWVVESGRAVWKTSRTKKARRNRELIYDVTADDIDYFLLDPATGSDILELLAAGERAIILSSLKTATGALPGAEYDDEDFPGEKPDDGSLEEDVPKQSRAKDSGTKIIVIKYTSSSGDIKADTSNQPIVVNRPVITKRPREDDDSADGDEDGSGNVTGTKRSKVGGQTAADMQMLSNADAEDRFTMDFGYDCRDIDALIKNKRISAIANQFSERTEAYEYCQARGVRCGEIEPDEDWQRDSLGFDIDAPLLHRIRMYALGQAEKRFKDDISARVKIQQARLEGLEQWETDHVKEFLAQKGSIIPERTTQLRQRLKEELENDLTMLQARPDAPAPQSAPVVPELDDPGESIFATYSEDDLDAYFRTNKLPSWGNPRARRVRAQRFLEYGPNDLPKGVRTGAINQTKGGKYFERVLFLRGDMKTEIYGFRANFERCSVLSLKSKLFEVGQFAANTTLTLYFGKDRTRPLRDKNALLPFYAAGGNLIFEDPGLEVVVRTYQANVAEVGEDGDAPDDDDEPEFVYNPKVSPAGPPSSGPSGTRPSGSGPSKSNPSGSGPSGSGSAGGGPSGNTTAATQLAPVSGGITVQRLLDDMALANQDLRALTQVDAGRDTLNSARRGAPSTSGTEILENLEDLRESNMDIDEILAEQVVVPNRQGRWDVRSHMDDLERRM